MKIFSASSGVDATYPAGVLIPCCFINSIDKYSCKLRFRTAPTAGVAVRECLDTVRTAVVNMVDSWLVDDGFVGIIMD